MKPIGMINAPSSDRPRPERRLHAIDLAPQFHCRHRSRIFCDGVQPRDARSRAAGCARRNARGCTAFLDGGAILGDTPDNSAVNRYLQSWDVSNVFVMGASAYPQNAGYNPTGTVGALTYWAAEAIRSRYLKNPGPLV